HFAACPRSLRKLVERTPELQAPYNSTLIALKRLRDVHIRITCLYIVNMSRKTSNRACPVAGSLQKSSHLARGTGGNSILRLLKHGEDMTMRPVFSGIERPSL
ncbi:hypothetical protein B0H14DRAFT_2404582, partial [Mycena olivaceomarginata]